uniref:Glycosyltransferase 61 catalytic domain-containing protein n=1 Tax=Chrysotila carterae TaxID=13221 RepID=A0A7S4C6H9_CHRCT
MACFATSYSLPIRYTNNVYHQAELVYAMLAGALPTPPDDIIWGAPPISAWARSMLQLMLPGARVHESINASEAVGCRVFNEAPSAGIYFRSAKTAKEIRAHALKQCGLADRQADIVTPLVVFMPRAAASSVQSAGRRNFVRRREIVEQLRMLNGSRVKVVPSPSASMPICEQISVWAMADAIATPNGAHFVNAPFLPRGAVLVEGVPWSMRHYVGQLRITQHFSTRHLRAHSSRPPPSPLLGRFSAVGSEQECEVNQACQHAYRDRANLHVEPQAIIAALSPLLNCRDDDDWQNPWPVGSARAACKTAAHS